MSPRAGRAAEPEATTFAQPTVGFDSRVQMLPYDEARTRRFPAGAITFGAELRTLDAAALTENYTEEYIAESAERFAEFANLDALEDGGPSVHIFDSASGDEVLRFDCFRQHPHYHYIFDVSHHINVAYDQAANGPMLPWTLQALRSARLLAMLSGSRGAALADQVDADEVQRAVTEMEAYFSEVGELSIGREGASWR